ncbi:MAG: hypothetical protein WB502_04365 [Thermoactinomyces sp.]
MMRRQRRGTRKAANKKTGTVHKKMEKLQLEDWNHVESKLFDSASENEGEPNNRHDLEKEEQPNPWNEWEEDWLFGDMDRLSEGNEKNQS